MRSRACLVATAMALQCCAFASDFTVLHAQRKKLLLELAKIDTEIELYHLEHTELEVFEDTQKLRACRYSEAPARHLMNIALTKLQLTTTHRHWPHRSHCLLSKWPRPKRP